jgi:hypothetical protein
VRGHSLKHHGAREVYAVCVGIIEHLDQEGGRINSQAPVDDGVDGLAALEQGERRGVIV